MVNNDLDVFVISLKLLIITGKWTLEL
uniref:Uncharacterized protein n=1 Tax=Anguilla anguilla TaxID=7936 RepID=A0A0E9WKF0_ANGAN